MGIPIERTILLADGEDLSALTVTAILHQLRENGQVAIQMRGGKVPGISRIARDVLGVTVYESEHARIDAIWQEALV